jgi:TetR/AcrR family transcriptional regulator, cholesterol catabolism regulator
MAKVAKAANRRDEILDVARELFAARGYAATSMRDIAQADGIRASSLYSHFPSKAEILRLVLTPFTDELAAVQERVLAGTPGTEPGSGLDQLRAMARAVLAVCVAHDKSMTILHYSWPQIRSSGDLEDLVAANGAIFARWHHVIEVGVADGSIRGDVDPVVTARLVTSALQGIADRQRYVDTAGLAARFGVGRLAADLDAVVLEGLADDRATLTVP